MKIMMGLSLLFLLSLPYATSAHQIINNGSATLLVHIEPGHDSAVAGKPVVIYVDLKNSENGFSIEKCNCVFSVEKEEKVIFSQKLVPATELNEFNMQGVPFTFPSEGAYNINVKAAPAVANLANLFRPFELETHAKVLPVGAELPASTETSMNNAHMHKHMYPQIMLIEGLIFTIIMGYFIFSNNQTLAKMISRKTTLNKK